MEPGVSGAVARGTDAGGAAGAREATVCFRPQAADTNNVANASVTLERDCIWPILALFLRAIKPKKTCVKRIRVRTFDSRNDFLIESSVGFQEVDLGMHFFLD